MSLLRSCMFSTHFIDIYHISVKSIVYQRRSHDRVSINENAKQERSKGSFEVAFHSNVISSSKTLKNKKTRNFTPQPMIFRQHRAWYRRQLVNSNEWNFHLHRCTSTHLSTSSSHIPAFPFSLLFSLCFIIFFVGPFLFRAKRTQLVYGRHTSR